MNFHLILMKVFKTPESFLHILNVHDRDRGLLDKTGQFKCFSERFTLIEANVMTPTLSRIVNTLNHYGT